MQKHVINFAWPYVCNCISKILAPNDDVCVSFAPMLVAGCEYFISHLNKQIAASIVKIHTIL